MKLLPDVKLSWGSEAWDPRRHLRINTGVEVRRPSLFHLLPEIAANGWKTEARFNGCYQPKPDWRPLDERELSNVVGVTDGCSMPGTVQIFEMPSDLIDRVRSHAESCVLTEQCTPIPHISAKQITGALMQPLKEPILNWLFENICEPFAPSGDMGLFIRINPPGRNSATGLDQRGWDGLHIDHWGGNNWLQMRRTYNGSRFIINAGKETRHFIYINLRLATIATKYATVIPAATYEILMRKDCQMTGLMASAFMEAFPDYPVLRVELPPGFGYISNSVSIPHDGYLAGKMHQDIAVLMQHSVDCGTDGEELLEAAALRYHETWMDRCRREENRRMQ